MRTIKSIIAKDPRKKAVVAALKEKSGGDKVTVVKENHETYWGNCFRWDGSKYIALGITYIEKHKVDAYPFDKRSK